MTLDRDIRITPEQLTVAQVALRAEVRKRTRSIEAAEAARNAGGRVQENVLESHYKARAAARELLETLEVAREQLAHRMAALVLEGSDRA